MRTASASLAMRTASASLAMRTASASFFFFIATERDIEASSPLSEPSPEPSPEPWVAVGPPFCSLPSPQGRPLAFGLASESPLVDGVVVCLLYWSHGAEWLLLVTFPVTGSMIRAMVCRLAADQLCDGGEHCGTNFQNSARVYCVCVYSIYSIPPSPN